MHWVSRSQAHWANFSLPYERILIVSMRQVRTIFVKGAVVLPRNGINLYFTCVKSDRFFSLQATV